MDAARVSQRLGAQSVQLVYRRGRRCPPGRRKYRKPRKKKDQMDFLVNLKGGGKTGK
jgi:hypothetical protein